MFLATYYKNKQQQTQKDINGRFKTTPILCTKLPPSNLWYLGTERKITRKRQLIQKVGTLCITVSAEGFLNRVTNSGDFIKD